MKYTVTTPDGRELIFEGDQIEIRDARTLGIFDDEGNVLAAFNSDAWKEVVRSQE